MSELLIDGSGGEGGGQILRTALSLAAIHTRPVHIFNIRAGRKKPGLRPQHVQAVQAAAAICRAQLKGAKEHSRELWFEPQAPVQPGSYRLTVPTAGSATLILQTVLVPLALAGAPSQVTVGGGTHVAWSPPFDYLQEVYLPALQPLGLRGSLQLKTWGFYPRGGGEIRLDVQPSGPEVAGVPAWSQPRGALKRLTVRSAAARVGNQVAARQAKQAYNRLAEMGYQPLIQTQVLNPPSPGPGTCLFLLAEYEGNVRAGFTGFGRLGYPAERVADDAVDAFLHFQESDAPVDPHLGDQLLLPLVASGHAAQYQVAAITQHLLTNVWLISQFLGQRIVVEGQEGNPGLVRCSSLPS